MTAPNLPPEFLERLKRVTGKRSRIVVDRILEHGFIATGDLEQIYGCIPPAPSSEGCTRSGDPDHNVQNQIA